MKSRKGLQWEYWGSGVPGDSELEGQAAATGEEIAPDHGICVLAGNMRYF